MLASPLEGIHADHPAVGMLQQVVEHPAGGEAFEATDLQNRPGRTRIPAVPPKNFGPNLRMLDEPISSEFDAQNVTGPVVRCHLHSR